MKDKSKILTVINTGKRKVESEQAVQQIIRGGAGSGSPGGAYLLKSIWDKCWEIRKTDQGEEYLFGKLPVAVQFGLTSYVDGGYLDLPSIYDGLVIDNQTIYWDVVREEIGTDEEGNPIYKTTKVLKAAGGGSGTGGSIEHALTWSGFSTGSYDGKSAKNIEIPNNTNQLTNGAGFITSSDLSGYATQTWVKNQGYVTSSNLSDYLPLNGALPTTMSNEFKLQGDLRLQKGTGASGRKILFGDGLNTYLYESPDNYLNIYAHNGMKIYTQSSKYIELSGKGVKVNNGIITYNESDGYFQLDGNLIVTGGITAFADSGSGNQWILDATALSDVTSTNQYKVYSARVTTLIKDEVDEIVDKIAAIKTAFNSLSSSSSASAIGGALKTLAGKL